MEMNEQIAQLTPEESSAAAMARAQPPTIAAIVPLYNGAAHIETALRSVLAQTLAPSEIIVVNDGSTDAGPSIVEGVARDYPIRLLHKENGGQSSARNFGVAHCTADAIAFLDQDDIWYPAHLRELARPFMGPTDGELGWVSSDFDEIDEDGNLVSRDEQLVQ